MDRLEKVKRLLAEVNETLNTDLASVLDYQIMEEVPWLVKEVEQLREALGRAARKAAGMPEVLSKGE